MLVPLAIINHFKPTRPLPDAGNARGTVSRRLSRTGPGFASRPRTAYVAEFFPLARQASQICGVNKQTPPVSQAGAEKMPRNGCWNALKVPMAWPRFFPAMLNSLIALKALGYPDDHPQIKRAECELKNLEHETERQRSHRTLLFAGLGHRHCGHLPA